jgi:TonB family protein
MVFVQAAESPSAPTPAVRVGGAIKEPQKVKSVPPDYPDDASRAGLAGQVVVECVVDLKGAITDARVLKGVPPLSDAALNAVKQWRYTTTLLDGKPVPVVMTVTVNFNNPKPNLAGLLESLKSKNEFIRESAVTWLGRQRGNPNLDKNDVGRITRELKRLKEHDDSDRVRAAVDQALQLLEAQ